MLNFCVNNYFGFVDDLCILDVVRVVLDEWGYGFVSVCFICGM